MHLQNLFLTLSNVNGLPLVPFALLIALCLQKLLGGEPPLRQ
jgi:hypothetical protein